VRPPPNSLQHVRAGTLVAMANLGLPPLEPRAVSIRDHLDRLLPQGGRGRRVVGWGVVAWTGLGAAALAFILARAFERVAGIFPYLIVAAMIVLILNPLVRRCVAFGLPRRLAAAIVFVVFVVAMAALLDLLIPRIISQAASLTGSAPGLVRKGGTLFDRLARSNNPLLHRAGASAASWLQEHAGNAPQALRSITDAGLRLAHAGLVLIIGGFLGFLLLLSLPETTRGLAALVPPARRDHLAPVLAEIRRIVSGYVRARLIVSAVVGVLATIGLFAIQLRFWLVLGLIVGIANLVPMLGSWIGGIPVALVTLVTKPPSFLFAALAVVVGAHLIDGFVLSPLILKETTHLHPVVILLVVIVGAELLGLWGILAAIPVAGVIQFVLRETVIPRMVGAPAPEEPVPTGEPARGIPG
jgi:predicted PurR-regulated permease PerM